MRQGLTDSCKTYIKLKNIIMKQILTLNEKSSLDNTESDIAFKHFVNNDLRDASFFKVLFKFLHYHYFSRLI